VYTPGNQKKVAGPSERRNLSEMGRSKEKQKEIKSERKNVGEKLRESQPGKDSNIKPKYKKKGAKSKRNEGACKTRNWRVREETKTTTQIKGRQSR